MVEFGCAAFLTRLWEVIRIGPCTSVALGRIPSYLGHTKSMNLATWCFTFSDLFVLTHVVPSPPPSHSPHLSHFLLTKQVASLQLHRPSRRRLYSPHGVIKQGHLKHSSYPLRTCFSLLCNKNCNTKWMSLPPPRHFSRQHCQ